MEPLTIPHYFSGCDLNTMLGQWHDKISLTVPHRLSPTHMHIQVLKFGTVAFHVLHSGAKKVIGGPSSVTNPTEYTSVWENNPDISFYTIWVLMSKHNCVRHISVLHP